MTAPGLSPHSRLTIGRFARLTGLSARTLRKYDAGGLLVPVATDPDTGYRHYSLSQVARAEAIRMLRSLDVPLVEVAAILDGGDAGAAGDLLERHLRRVEHRIEEARRTILRIESAVARGGVLGTYHCALRDEPAQTVVAVRVTSPRESIDAAVAAALDSLGDHVRRRRLDPTGREVVVYDFDPFEQDDYVADVCLPVTPPALPGPGIAAFELPACTGAVTTHRGPDEDLQGAYFSLLGWIIDNGLRIAGHERERYPVDERDSADPRDHVTEVMWPVEPA